MQEDTYRGDGQKRYVYCANNPVMYYDPSGHTQVTNCDGNGLKNQEQTNNGADIPWSSGVVSDASRQLDNGATSVSVNNRSQAEELFLGKYQGEVILM